MQRQVEDRRVGNQLPVLGKGTSMILKQSCVFRNTRSHFDRAMYVFLKCGVSCLLTLVRVAFRRCTTVPVAPSGGEKY